MAYFFWQGSTAAAGVARFDWNYGPNWKVSANVVTNFSTLGNLPSATSAPGPLDYAYIGNVSTPTNPVGYGLDARSPLLYGGCSGTVPIGGSTTTGGSPIWLNAVRGTTGTTFTSSLQSIFIDLGHRKGSNGLTSCKYAYPWLGGGIRAGAAYSYGPYIWAIADGMNATDLDASLTGTTGARAADGLNLKVASTIDIFTTGSITGAMPPSNNNDAEGDYSQVKINLIPSKAQSYSNNSGMASCSTKVRLRPDYWGNIYGAGEVKINRYRQYGTNNYGGVPLIQTLEIFGVGTAGTTAGAPLTWTTRNPKAHAVSMFGTTVDDTNLDYYYKGGVILNTKIYEIGDINFSTGITFGEMQIGTPSFAGNVLPYEGGTDPTIGDNNTIGLVAPIFDYVNAASTLGYATTNYSNLLSKSGIKLYQLYGLSNNSYPNYNYTPRIQIIEDRDAIVEGNPITAKIPTLIGALSSTRTNTNGYRATNLSTIPWRIEIGAAMSCTAATIASSTVLTSMDYGDLSPSAQININTLNMSTNATLDLTSTYNTAVNNWFFGTLTGNSIIGGINFNDATPVIKADPDITFFNTKLAVGIYDNRGSTNVAVAGELLEKGIFNL
jgi:hypothetical protein